MRGQLLSHHWDGRRKRYVIKWSDMNLAEDVLFTCRDLNDGYEAFAAALYDAYVSVSAQSVRNKLKAS